MVPNAFGLPKIYRREYGVYTRGEVLTRLLRLVPCHAAHRVDRWSRALYHLVRRGEADAQIIQCVHESARHDKHIARSICPFSAENTRWDAAPTVPHATLSF